MSHTAVVFNHYPFILSSPKASTWSFCSHTQFPLGNNSFLFVSWGPGRADSPSSIKSWACDTVQANQSQRTLNSRTMFLVHIEVLSPLLRLLRGYIVKSGATGSHLATLRSRSALEWSQQRKAESTRLSLDNRVWAPNMAAPKNHKLTPANEFSFSSSQCEGDFCLLRLKVLSNISCNYTMPDTIKDQVLQKGKSI